jgi:REP element-mobilizing transposase RayT
MSSGILDKFSGYHNRRSIRLRDYDYSRSGFYFITICIHDHRQRFFGDIFNGKMIFNECGNIAYDKFDYLCERFRNIRLDTFQIMPNHIHAIVQIVGATLAVARDGDAVAP